MSDPGKVIIVLSAFGSVVYVIRFVAQQFGDARRHSRPRQGVIDASDDRLARLEQAVESIAIEVERISEGQRFTTKLLTERGQADQFRGAEQPAFDRRPDQGR
jgi:hypothetical protein